MAPVEFQRDIASTSRFCTLFNSYYLTRGLALHSSLVRSGASFHLYIYCFDELSHSLLTDLNLPSTTLVTLGDFETPALLSVKGSRTVGEYCWTCTSHVIDDCLRRFELSEVTYLDADLFFFEKPDPLLEEFHRSDASVLITEHRYKPEYDQSATSGKYCVQFMTFRNDSEGNCILTWWKQRCLEWCYARAEDGKFGDQKYLDDWTTRFKKVHVLQNLGGGIAPWNISQYRVTPGPRIDGHPVVFYHFHNLQWLMGDRFDLTKGAYRIQPETVDLIYEPYIETLMDCRSRVRQVHSKFNKGVAIPKTGLRRGLSALKQRIKGTYRVLSF